MTIIHIQNKVRDFESWKTNFDKFERFRAQNGVRSYRVLQGIEDPNQVVVDLEFADQSTATGFLPKLATIMSSPQAREQLETHSEPRLYSVVSDQRLAPIN